MNKRSEAVLGTAHVDLQRLMYAVSMRTGISVRTGFRSRKAQTAAVKAGKSKTPWPRSKHNKQPSHAVDILPAPFRTEYWRQRKVWDDLAAVVLEEARKLDIKIRWGGDWNGNGIRDENFVDCPHFELVDEG